MANGSTYDFGAAFGLLTATLEDATNLAAEGQSSNLNRTTHLQLTHELDLGLKKAKRVLEEIRSEL